LHRVIALLPILTAVALLLGHAGASGGRAALGRPMLRLVGVACGLVIGVVAALLGVAGGELLIPTITLLFEVDIKLAGSLSLAVSLPTMLGGFARYSRDQSFAVLGRQRRFLGVMAVGSIVGALIGGQLLGIVSNAVLLPLLAAILVLSALKVGRHPKRGAGVRRRGKSRRAISSEA
jgi:uncharacterized membrane protein YfcA